ncbi:Aromatic-amino-acid aminotransferase 1 [Frankliniella fusca]|uniref:Aromatic-amino-acid aminotransferase 1 n=1 Tax=Frankliniella fusca TaxID=407009 RepID=A0AAE1LDG4_9NEOP|nr:Aromatic-amino-acid aminotransferase 1 [Frankliniella fusca]
MSADQRGAPAGNADGADVTSGRSGPSGRLPRLRHLFDGDDTNVYNDDICNLCAGTPGPDLLRHCADIFEEATAHRMASSLDRDPHDAQAHERKDAFLFQYGATAGPWDFREELSSFLTARYDDPVNA